jgi:hypothetical protein
MLKDRYAGFKEQARRILPRIKSLLRSGQPITEEILTSLEAEISQLPTKDANSERSPDFQSGLNLFKQDIARNVRNLKKAKQTRGEPDLGEKLNNIASSYSLLER